MTLSKPCSCASCSRLIVHRQPAALAKRRYCNHACWVQDMKDRGIQIGRYLTPEGRSRGGLNGAKVRRQNGVARRLDAVRHLLPAWLTDECDDSERARLLALLCRTYQRGFTQGRRQRDKTRKAAMRRTA